MTDEAPVPEGAVLGGTETVVVVLPYGAVISLVLETMTEEAPVPDGAVVKGTEMVAQAVETIVPFSLNQQLVVGAVISEVMAVPGAVGPLVMRVVELA